MTSFYRRANFNWLMPAAFCSLAIVSLCLIVGQPAVGEQHQGKSIAGKWQGSFPPEDPNQAQEPSVPAVDLTIREDSGRLSGTATFYIVVDEGNGPKVEGKDEAPLIDPQFDGTCLKFSVRVKTPDSDQRVKTDMNMRLVGENEAELRDSADTGAQVVKMKKVE